MDEEQPLLAGAFKSPTSTLEETDVNNNGNNGVLISDLPLQFRRFKYEPSLSKIASSDSSSMDRPVVDEDNDDNDTEQNRGQHHSLFAASSKSKNALYFGTRVAILIGLSSLFATNQIPLGHGRKMEWPQGMWVTVSTLMVCWFPRLDAASVIKKSCQRFGGTMVGGILALATGRLSRWILPLYVYRRAIFLHVACALICFLVCYLSMTLKIGNSTIMAKYEYGTMLCLLTFTITLFPFLEQSEPWKKAFWRMMNVTFGVFFAAVGSSLILPRSTTDVLLERIQKQCQWAGESSEAVLHAAANALPKDNTPPPHHHHSSPHLSPTPPKSATAKNNSPKARKSAFSSRASGNFHRFDSDGSLESRWSVRMWDSIRVSVLHRSFFRVHREIMEEQPTMTALDVVLKEYESAIRDWKDTKELFGLLWFDPFHFFFPTTPEFQSGCAKLLSRSLRVQTTVVLLDGIIRNDPHHLVSLDSNLIALLTEMGTLIRKMLVVPRQFTVETFDSGSATRSRETNDNSSVMTATSAVNDLAKERLLDRLQKFRDSVNRMASRIIVDPPETNSNNPLLEGSSSHLFHNKTNSPGSRHYALLFLQLVEHLTHRSISVYDSWVDMEEEFDTLYGR